MTDGVRLLLGDCQARMAEIEDASVDCIISDPPYPCVNRPYGRMTEEEWHRMMFGVVQESRRILKPSGSAVFILQPNSEKVGRMRPWLFEFQAWTAREWNMVQDVHWWNISVLPVGGAITGGLMRPSLKACVWLGEPDCYRDQIEVLWTESDENAARRKADKVKPGEVASPPSGWAVDRHKCRLAAETRGGTTPHNVIPMRGVTASQSASSDGHPAATPFDLCDWWVRYLTPPDGIVCDPFAGSGTTGLAALKRGRRFIGIERDEGYFKVMSARIADYLASTPLLGVG